MTLTGAHAGYESVEQAEPQLKGMFTIYDPAYNLPHARLGGQGRRDYLPACHTLETLTPLPLLLLADLSCA